MSMKAIKTRPHLIPCVVTGLMLFLALGTWWTYQYYTVQRIVVFAVSVFMVLVAINWKKWPVMLPFIVMAVLFNPISPLSLDINLWRAIDIPGGILFIVSAFALKKPEQLKYGIITGYLIKKKRIVRIAVPAVIIIVLAVVVGRQAYFAIYGDERLTGLVETIPEQSAIFSPIEKGEADWPSWRGPNGDGKSTVTGIIKDFSGGLNKLWEVNFLCQGQSNVAWSAVAVAGNRLVVPGRDRNNDLVFCLDPQSGEIIWSGSYEAKTRSSHGPGSRATAFIDDERVYTFGRSGDLVCWSLEDGELLWRQNVEDSGGKEPQWGHSSSPLVYQDKVIVQGGGDALVIAYDKMTGGVIWKSMQGEGGYAAVTSMEIDGSVRLLVFYGTGLACINPDDGRDLWSVDWQTSYGVNATTPAVSGSIVFITSGYDTGCQALRVTDGGLEILWTSKVFASQHSDPILIDGFIYGYSGQSDQNEGWFKCVELETGKEMWSSDQIGWGTTLYVDGHLLCMDIEGNLFLVEPDPSEFRKVTQLQGALGQVDHPAWTIPVIANGRLYLRYMQRLICYDIMSQLGAE
ncbi:DUF6804 family protein [Planctomycetota bacterium]